MVHHLGPTEPIATRPLAIQKDGTWYTYCLDLTKNVCEVFSSAGYIATTYTYSPYGPFSFASKVVLFNYVMQIKITLRIF